MRGLRLLLVVGAVVGLTGCGGGSDCGEGTHDENGTCVPDEESATDGDGDGVVEEDDCDDSDAAVGAVAEDADCDGSLTADDCDDTDPTIYPGASEVWDDGIDQDCDGVADIQGASCSADFTVTFPDGTSTTLDGCTNWDFDASMEYDPDDPPEVIDFTFTLGATNDAGFDCRVELQQQGVCGPGYYDQRDSTTSTTLVLMDCSGVGDIYENAYTPTEGYLRIDTLDAGTQTGSFQGAPLETTLEGHLHVWTTEGIDLEGDLALTLTQVVGDGEEQTQCVLTDGDVDGDGSVGPYFDGTDCDDGDSGLGDSALDADCDGALTADDCDDSDPDVYPGAADMYVDGVDQNCDGTDGVDADGDGVASAASGGPDCDDADAALGDVSQDEDCDGALTADDCDDADPDIFPWDRDGDGFDEGCGWLVSAGHAHTCGVKSDGSVECWGGNDYGQSTPPSGTFESVSAGGTHTCGVTGSGSVECWVHDDSGQSTPPSGTFESVSAGGYHTCGVKSDGSVECWGSDGDGQSSPPTGAFQIVSAGTNHTCGVNSSGSVECWGNAATPPSGTFQSVSAGDGHTCGVTSTGTVECWGWDLFGQSSPPSGVFQSVSAGGYHTCGVNSSGSVECWGNAATP